MDETQRLRLRTVAALSLLFTYLFFVEYLPPFQRVHIPYDLEGFHYPLFDYTFRALGNGRFPEWDPTIYCGLSFVGNVQAALFYPPAWLIFAGSVGREHVSFAALEIVVILHVWLAFVLCYGWLRGNGLRGISSALGAALFSFSGYLLLQLQHFGVTAGYAWMPLGLWGIDEASRSRGWRPLWKLALASAMCFLAGYPPLWTVFAVSMLAYAVCRSSPLRVFLGTGLGLAFSMLLAAVQLLPALQSSALKVFEARYGSGFRDPKFYISYFVPNYFDFGLHVDPMTNFGREYLYLGAAALFGLYWTPRARLRSVVPALGMLVASAIALTNAFNLVGSIVEHSTLLAQVCRDWYFLAGITLAAAPLSAAGIDAFLDRSPTPGARRAAAVAAALGLWTVFLLVEWRRDAFPAGPRAILEPVVTLALVTFGMYALRAESGRRRILVGTLLLITVAAEYKAFGTAKRFNAGLGKVPRPELLTGSDRSVPRELQANALYRVVLDETAPFPPSLRSFGLTTPQGFDPMITTQFRDVMEKIAHFRTNWLIDFDPAKVDALRLLGVRYYITSEGNPRFEALRHGHAFRPLGPPVGYYRVFELIDASPPYACESCVAQVAHWEPEHREFAVRSTRDARLALIEQAFPGWTARIDNTPAPIESYGGAFQSVRAPAGVHRITFDYQSIAMRIGGAISAVSVLVLILFAAPFRRVRALATDTATPVQQ